MEDFDWIMGAVLPYINFTLFLIMLYFFGRKPMAGIVQDRYQKYVDLHAQAKNAYEEAAVKHQELNDKLTGLSTEIDELKKISLQNAKHEYDTIVEQAKHLGEHIIDEARMIADAEVESAKEQIREEIVHQLTAQVEQKIQKDVDAGKHAALIDRQSRTVEGLGMEGANL